MNKKPRRFSTMMALLLVCINAAAAGQQENLSPHARLHEIFDEYHEAYLRLNPLNAMFEGDYRYNDVLGNDLTPEYRQRSEQLEQETVDKLKGVDYQALDEEDRISYDIFKYDRDIDLEGYVRGYAGMDALMPISQFSSLPNFFALMGSGASAQPFKTAADYENWMKRAGGLPAWTDQAIANMREGIKAHVVLPKVIVEKVLPQLKAHLVDNINDSVFYKPVSSMPETIAGADRDRLAAAMEQTIRGVIIPCYQRLYDFFRDEYLPNARASVGLGALPGGQAFYAYLVRVNTTTDMTPQQIHAIGKEDARRIHQEMLALKDRTGFKGDLQAFFKFMKTNPRFHYKSVKEMLDSFRSLKKDVLARVPKLFSLMPRAKLVVRPMESFRAASAASAQYMRPAPDDSRPGVFYLNTYDLPSRLTWNRESIFLHEAVPGHHFQISIAQEQEQLPSFRRFQGPTAFVEGWALYAESLGTELGFYTDPYQRIGALSNEIWRANRLVVDTGIHALGWTRQQGIDWMKSNMPMTETEAVAEVERYIAIPGQALAYKIGQRKITELRRYAQQRLGDRFDIRAFHSQILKDGAMPLEVLDKKIRAWVAGLGS